ncbi:hypothetical protein HVW54_23345 (plasmid) [Escherichia coli]|nr:hypothetical protein HVW54_23345 [Escherichia coli]
MISYQGLVRTFPNHDKPLDKPTKKLACFNKSTRSWRGTRVGSLAAAACHGLELPL